MEVHRWTPEEAVQYMESRNTLVDILQQRHIFPKKNIHLPLYPPKRPFFHHYIDSLKEIMKVQGENEKDGWEKRRELHK